MNLELETVKKCSAKLALALRGIDGGFVYFLNNEGFISDEDLNRILEPVSVLTAAQKAEELVRLIKERVELSPDHGECYETLVAELRRRGRRFEPIVRILGEEYAKQKQAAQGGSGTVPIGSDFSAHQNPSSSATQAAATATAATATGPAGNTYQLLSIRLVDGAEYSAVEHDGSNKIVQYRAEPRGILKPKLKLKDGDISPQKSNQKSLPSAYYDMAAGKHGVALIINNRTFKNPKHGERHGTERDEHNAHQTFRFLGYRTLIARDLTSTEILDLFQHLDDYLRASDAKKGAGRVSHDSFVCCILSHGESGAVIGHDSQPVKLSNILSAAKASTILDSRPKIFFIQACQGEGHGQVVPDGGPKSHIYICLATIDGNVALRDTVKGSWFIMEVCKILCEYATCDNFPDDFERHLKANLTDNEEYRVEVDGKKYAQQPAKANDLDKPVHFFYER